MKSPGAAIPVSGSSPRGAGGSCGDAAGRAEHPPARRAAAAGGQQRIAIQNGGRELPSSCRGLGKDEPCGTAA